jgi:hypothetical protein
MHGSLVTSSLIRETTENESTNYGYKFGQEEDFAPCAAAKGAARAKQSAGQLKQSSASSLWPVKYKALAQLVNKW